MCEVTRLLKIRFRKLHTKIISAIQHSSKTYILMGDLSDFQLMQTMLRAYCTQRCTSIPLTVHLNAHGPCRSYMSMPLVLTWQTAAWFPLAWACCRLGKLGSDSAGSGIHESLLPWLAECSGARAPNSCHSALASYNSRLDKPGKLGRMGLCKRGFCSCDTMCRVSPW